MDLMSRRRQLLMMGSEKIIYQLKNVDFLAHSTKVDTGIPLCDGRKFRIFASLTLSAYSNNSRLFGARKVENGTTRGFEFRTFSDRYNINRYELVVSNDHFFNQTPLVVGEQIEVVVEYDGSTLKGVMNGETITMEMRTPCSLNFWVGLDGYYDRSFYHLNEITITEF